MWFSRLFFGLVFLLLSARAQAIVQPATYGITEFPDHITLEQGAKALADSIIATHPLMASTYIISDIEHPHIAESQTADFYLLLSLCLILGLIRFMDTRYFINLWRAFWNPTLSNRQLKEQLQGAGLPNLLMNIFFAFAGGAYIFHPASLRRYSAVVAYNYAHSRYRAYIPGQVCSSAIQRLGVSCGGYHRTLPVQCFPDQQGIGCGTNSLYNHPGIRRSSVGAAGSYHLICECRHFTA